MLVHRRLIRLHPGAGTVAHLEEKGWATLACYAIANICWTGWPRGPEGVHSGSSSGACWQRGLRGFEIALCNGRISHVLAARIRFVEFFCLDGFAFSQRCCRDLVSAFLANSPCNLSLQAETVEEASASSSKPHEAASFFSIWTCLLANLHSCLLIIACR